MLGTTVASTMSIAEAQERISTYLPLLEAEFDQRFFCSDSLRYVARRTKFFPTFSEVCEHLHEWGTQKREASRILLANPDRDGLTEMDHEHLASLQRRRHEKGFKLDIALSRLRQLAPAAFRKFCQTDTEAASIAVKRRWIVESEDRDPQLGWGNRAAVINTIRKCREPLPDGRPNQFTKPTLAALRAALERYAPENLDLLDSTPYQAAAD